MKSGFQTRIVVYVEIILFVLGVLGAVVVICLPSVMIDSLLEDEPDSHRRDELKSQLGLLTVIVAAIVVIVLLVWLIIVILLYIGAKDKSIGRLMLWLVINCIVCSLQVFTVLVTLVLNPKLVIVHIPSFIFLAYRIYSLYVIRTFMIQIRYNIPQQSIQQYAGVQYSHPYYEDPSTSRQYSQAHYSAG